jgi:ATP-dependent RNA helicase DDX21
VFAQTKIDANSIILSEKMRNNAEVLHGDIAQNQREVTLKRFREGKFNVLVATDVASRGLDIPNVDLIVQLEPPKDVESYIHRSGRTARAGKEGICITFYNGREYNAIQEIEYEAGIKIKKISPPKKEDVLKVAAADVLENLKMVDKKLLPLFQEAADAFIAEVGAREALCMALAFVSETSKEHLNQTSYISGEEGMVTYILRADREIRAVSHAYKVLQRNFAENVWSQAKAMRILKHAKGVAFDLPQDVAEEFDIDFKEQSCSKKSLDFTIEKASEAPEFEDDRGGYNKYGSGGSRGSKNGGFQTQRYSNQKSDYYGGGDDGYNQGYKKSTRGGYKNDGYSKGSDHYDQRSGGGARDSGHNDDEGIKFKTDRPTFFSRNKPAEAIERPQTEGKVSSSRGGFETGGGSSRGRGGRGFQPRGRGRGRGDF